MTSPTQTNGGKKYNSFTSTQVHLHWQATWGSPMIVFTLPLADQFIFWHIISKLHKKQCFSSQSVYHCTRLSLSLSWLLWRHTLQQSLQCTENSCRGWTHQDIKSHHWRANQIPSLSPAYTLHIAHYKLQITQHPSMLHNVLVMWTIKQNQSSI